MRNQTYIKHTVLTLSVLTLMLVFSNCKKDEQFYDKNDAYLNFSTDILAFDTVFSTITSPTKQLMVYNPHSKSIKISSIYIGGMSQSNFNINVNGRSGTSFTDIEIAAKDSIFIFVNVNLNQGNQDLPFLISDSIVFSTNGNIQSVDLLAYGQDANFIVADTYREGLPPYKIVAHEGEAITWTKDKPYVIYGYAVIDSVGSLLIEAGTQIYFHKNAGIWVYKGGKLEVLGTKDDKVVFQGDRLEEWYADAAGQWDRIWINEGTQDNVIRHAIIKNSFIGIQAETLDISIGNKLILENTEIRNSSGIGLFSRGYNIEAKNNIIANSGQYCVALTLGGEYKFIHNTFVNYWTSGIRHTPAFYVNNYFITAQGTYVSDMNVSVANSIIYGNNENELELDGKTDAQFDYKFENCLIRSSEDFDSEDFINCLKNKNPLFENQAEYDFRLSSDSPCRGAGSEYYVPFAPYDMDENSRMSPPDIGAYEFTE